VIAQKRPPALTRRSDVPFHVLGDSGLRDLEAELEKLAIIQREIARDLPLQAGPNEVLVSRVVTDVVAGAGLNFSNRGTHELKGLPGLWDLFAASA
jgi:hypothetical protein